MKKIVKCNICGKVPEIQKSYSSRMISHKCKDYHSGWSNLNSVIDNWNDNNSPKEEENSNNTQQLKAEIKKAYAEGYSKGHWDKENNGDYCPEQSADDWLSELSAI